MLETKVRLNDIYAEGLPKKKFGMDSQAKGFEQVRRKKDENRGGLHGYLSTRGSPREIWGEGTTMGGAFLTLGINSIEGG